MKTFAAWVMILGSMVGGGFGLYLGIAAESMFLGIMLMIAGLLLGFSLGLILMSKADENERKKGDKRRQEAIESYNETIDFLNKMKGEDEEKLKYYGEE